MNTSIFALTAANLFIAGAALADIPAGGLENLHFKGLCHLDRGSAQWFSLPVNASTILAIPEVDGFGAEVVTNIQVSFVFGDGLGAAFTADLQPPQVGQAHASDLQLGVRLSTVLPSHLGDKIFCDGTVVREAAP